MWCGREPDLADGDERQADDAERRPSTPRRRSSTTRLGGPAATPMGQRGRARRARRRRAISSASGGGQAEEVAGHLARPVGGVRQPGRRDSVENPDAQPPRRQRHDRAMMRVACPSPTFTSPPDALATSRVEVARGPGRTAAPTPAAPTAPPRRPRAMQPCASATRSRQRAHRTGRSVHHHDDERDGVNSDDAVRVADVGLDEQRRDAERPRDAPAPGPHPTPTRSTRNSRNGRSIACACQMSISSSLPIVHVSAAQASSIHRCIAHPPIWRAASDTPTIAGRVDGADPDRRARPGAERVRERREEIGVERTRVVHVLADDQRGGGPRSEQRVVGGERVADPDVQQRVVADREPVVAQRPDDRDDDRHDDDEGDFQRAPWAGPARISCAGRHVTGQIASRRRRGRPWLYR